LGGYGGGGGGGRALERRRQEGSGRAAGLLAGGASQELEHSGHVSGWGLRRGSGVLGGGVNEGGGRGIRAGRVFLRPSPLPMTMGFERPRGEWVVKAKLAEAKGSGDVRQCMWRQWRTKPCCCCCAATASAFLFRSCSGSSAVASVWPSSP